VAGAPLRALRRLRWRAIGWSKTTDQQYHDRFYQGPDYNPFSLDYPGYVTIRRFADHAEVLLPESGTVLDVGCGPGEITCELARRHPHLTFIGIDHSAAGIDRARHNATRLGLNNVTFAAGDAETIAADGRFGLVTMFDAFHHIEQPERFLDWLRLRTSRCLLVEPAGTALGTWMTDLDVDWLLADLASIRERLEVLSAAESRDLRRTEAAGSSDLAPGDGAVERRYATDDFQAFFAGWQLHITGTIAGFESYPVQPHATGPLRAVFGEAAYQAVCAAERELVRNGRDGLARHWVVAATTEQNVIEPRIPAAPALPVIPPTKVRGRFDARYQEYEGPTTLKCGGEARVAVTIVNAGWDTWRSDGDRPVFASYHWLARDGATIVELDGVRSPLPRALGPGDECRIMLTLRAPVDPGRLVLAIDLVKEGTTWFSEAGAPWLLVPISVV
jgi:SAM-dependent methyltransferase